MSAVIGARKKDRCAASARGKGGKDEEEERRAEEASESRTPTSTSREKGGASGPEIREARGGHACPGGRGGVRGEGGEERAEDKEKSGRQSGSRTAKQWNKANTRKATSLCPNGTGSTRSQALLAHYIQRLLPHHRDHIEPCAQLQSHRVDEALLVRAL